MTTWNTAGENTEALGRKLREEFVQQAQANGVTVILLNASVMSPATEAQQAELWGSLARVADQALTITAEQKAATGSTVIGELPA